MFCNVFCYINETRRNEKYFHARDKDIVKLITTNTIYNLFWIISLYLVDTDSSNIDKSWDYERDIFLLL